MPRNKKIGFFERYIRLPLSALTVAFLIFSTVFSVMEISGRISAESFILDKINRINSEISGLTGVGSNGDSFLDSRDHLSQLHTELAEYEVLHDQISQLDFSGANSISETIYSVKAQSNIIRNKNSNEKLLIRRKEELSKIKEDKTEIISEINGLLFDKEYIEDENEIRRNLNKTRELQDKVKLIDDRIEIINNEIHLIEGSLYISRGAKDRIFKSDFVNIIYKYLSSSFKFSFMPTDLLLAIAVVSSGAIGSVTAGLRSNSGNIGRALTLGLAAGFIAFLVIKGGKFVFIVQSGGQSSLPINPYTAAFCGVLAGLFTERAYFVLSQLIDEAVSRVTGSGN